MVAMVTEHGVATSGTWAQRPRNAHHGAKFYADDKYRSFTFDANLMTWMPDDGKTFYDATSKYLVDCFRGAVLDGLYSVAEGNDNVTALAVLDTDQQGGEVDLVTGDAGSGTAADGTAMAGPLVWEMEEAAVQTRLFMRAKISAITNVAFYLGFTDTLPASTLEMPFTLATTTFTSNATDGGGLLFDTAATTDTIRGIGVDTDVDSTTPLNTGVAPTADTYMDFLLLVTPAGLASVYLNGTLYGTFTMSPDVDVCPIAIAEARSTASRTLSIALLICHQDG